MAKIDTSTKAPFDPERVIADKIMAAIAAGTAPWRKPWTGGAGCPFPLRAAGERYRGINVLSLWLEANERGYASPFWLTYRKAAELGGPVRRGERSTLVVKFGVLASRPRRTCCPPSAICVQAAAVSRVSSPICVLAPVVSHLSPVMSCGKRAPIARTRPRRVRLTRTTADPPAACATACSTVGLDGGK
jgi:hypothetical protein